MEPEVEYTFGDGIVDAWGLLAAPLKWAYQYQNNEDGSEPVKIVNWCSRYNQKNNIYDKEGNEFMGLKCKCMDTGKYENCNHSNILSDDYVIEFI